MALIRPRLTDYHGVFVAQEKVDFAIPYLDEDIPFYVDPFLLWKSPSQQDTSLHSSLINSFNHLVHLSNSGKEDQATSDLIIASECNEAGLGYSGNRQGAPLGTSTASKLIKLFREIQILRENGFLHLEEIQFLVDKVSKDRISDISCSYLKSFLIDYTIEQSKRYGIPLEKTEVKNVYDSRTNKFQNEVATLPLNPITKLPLVLIPKRWLRKIPWINNEDYYFQYIPKVVLDENELHKVKGDILTFNRNMYGLVRAYIQERERTAEDCHNDPLFIQIPVLSAKRKFRLIKSLKTGKSDNADKKYENLISQLLATLLYPELDFASEQARTDSGVHIRDLIFYNNSSDEFFSNILNFYGSKQIVFELKNVNEVTSDHVDQLNRYLSHEFGNFGVIATRNPLPKKVFKNTVDLWAGQRKCIIALTDLDIETMSNLYESKQRKPFEVIKKKYIEFTRALPS